MLVKVTEPLVTLVDHVKLDVLDAHNRKKKQGSTVDTANAGEVLFAHLSDAVLAVIYASDEEQIRKSLVLALLHKTQSPQDHIRLAAVKIILRIFQQRGHEVTGSLSDVMLFIVELLEDSCEEVEMTTRKLIKTIEDVTGEDIADQLQS